MSIPVFEVSKPCALPGSFAGTVTSTFANDVGFQFVPITGLNFADSFDTDQSSGELGALFFSPSDPSTNPSTAGLRLAFVDESCSAFFSGASSLDFTAVSDGEGGYSFSFTDGNNDVAFVNPAATFEVA